MSTNEQYRTNAEDCLRMARAVENDRDKPFWLTLAQSWLQLAEQQSRVNRSRSQPWHWRHTESER
jgi:putative IMPACT (imprinted ancient) family translation regulator